MKRVLLTITLFLLGVFLISCGNDSKKNFEKVKEEKLIIFHPEDDIDHVTHNLTFLLKSATVDEATISWESNKPDIIKISGSSGIVTRTSQDETVEITATITIGKKEEKVKFNLKVLKLDPTIQEYQVTFESNGGSSVASVKVKYGELITKPNDPVKNNYVFKGWYKDPEFKNAWDFASDKVIDNIKLYAKWEQNNSNLVEQVLYEFDFANTEFGNSYSGNNNATKQLPNLKGGSIEVVLTRAAANDNHGKYKDPFLVISAGLKGNEVTEASVIFKFNKEISKIEFEAAYWSQYDVNELTKLVLQANVNGGWQDVYNVRESLDGTLEYKKIIISNLNGQEFRIYATGIAPTGTGSNGARVIFDNFKAYTKSSGSGGETPKDTTPPVIQGATDITIEVGDTYNFLQGVSAIDDVDGIVAVTILSNNVDNTKVGEYEIVFRAVDKSGNEATKKIKVFVVAPSTGEGLELEFAFDFEDSNTGSTYKIKDENKTTKNTVTNSNFTMVLTRAFANTKTGYEGGKALVLSSSSKDNTNDVAYAIFDFKKTVTKIEIEAFFWSEYDVNENLKFVLQVDNNGIWVDVADLRTLLASSLTPKKLEFKDLTGSKYRFYAEGKQSTNTNGGRILIDNMKVYTGTELTADQVLLNKDKDALKVNTRFLLNGNIILPKQGNNGSSITWAYKDKLNTNNSLINLETGMVTVPTLGTVTVSLQATLKIGSYEVTKDFAIVLGEGEIEQIKNVYNLEENTQVKTQGVITSILDNMLIIEDNERGIVVYLNSNITTNVKVGDEITVIGTIVLIDGQVSIDDVKRVNVLGTKEISVVKLEDPKDFSKHVGKKVEITGILSKTTSNNTYVLINEFATFDVVIPNKLSETEKNNIKSKMSGFELGVSIKVTGHVITSEESYVLYVTSANNLVSDGTINVLEIEKVVDAYLILPTGGKVKTNILLPTSLSLMEAITINWTSSNPNAISNTGVVNVTNEDVNVRLTYLIKLGTNEIKTGYIDFIVSNTNDYSGYYATLNGLSGNALKTELTRIISQMKKVSYDDARYILDDSDADPLKKGNVILVYNRASVKGAWDSGATWNREHIWPQSKLGNASDSDLHNLKPANPNINSSRGNDPFVSGSGTYTKKSGGWFPGDADKGDIARIVFYMNIRWGLAINSNIGSLTTFIEWHNADPVDDFERNRNEVIYQNQKNRNPFIDYPELVEAIYSSVVNNLSSYKETNITILGERILELNSITVVVIENKKEEFFA